MSGGPGVQRISGLNPNNIGRPGAGAGMLDPVRGFFGSGGGPSISFGPILAAYGALTSAIGGFYAAKSKKYELKSSALEADYEASVANLNARQAEQQASDYMRAGEQAIAQRTLQGGLARSGQRAAQAARGIEGGVGSAAEVVASGDIVTEIEVNTLNSNRVRAANQARLEAVNQRNRASFAAMSARNLRRSAGTINPYVSAATSLLGSAASYAAAKN